MKWFGKYKKAVKNLTIAGFIGLFSALTLMIPYSHNSEAAIAVFDERNIEEAVKTAIQTANILLSTKSNPLAASQWMQNLFLTATQNNYLAIQRTARFNALPRAPTPYAGTCS